MSEASSHASLPTLGPPGTVAPRDRRVLLFLLLCVPGVFTAAVLTLDHLTRSAFGSSFTANGFLGGLLGLAAFFLGFVSILAWPAILLLGARLLRHSTLSPRFGGVMSLVFLVATYSAVYFLFWFVILPLAALWGWHLP